MEKKYFKQFRENKIIRQTLINKAPYIETFVLSFIIRGGHFGFRVQIKCCENQTTEMVLKKGIQQMFKNRIFTLQYIRSAGSKEERSN